MAAAYAALSNDELTRAAKFRDPRLGARFAFGRFALRRLLAQHLDRDPWDLTFHYSPYGKPELADLALHGLHFNVTHSHNLALIGLRVGAPLGVDMERFRPDFSTDDIAARFFAAGELQSLQAMPAHERVAAFFRCWSRKEAFIKAIGEGLSFPLDEFEVSPAQTNESALISIRGSREAASRWTLRDLPCPAGFAAAIAAEGTVGQLVMHQWDT